MSDFSAAFEKRKELLQRMVDNGVTTQERVQKELDSINDYLERQQRNKEAKDGN